MNPERREAVLRWGRASIPTLRYCMQTEVHVYAFSIAANVLLSFYPFLLVMLSVCRYAFEWTTAENAIYLALGDYFPGDTGDFLERNLRVTVSERGPLQLGSMLLLFFTANGIFEPLEVALNRAWGVTRNRSFFRNQVVSLALIFLCGGLFLASTVFTALNQDLMTRLMGGNAVTTLATLLLFKAAAVPISIFLLFLIYWLLPNRRIPARALAVPAILVGFALEFLKYVNLLTWPFLRRKLEREYGVFVNSATIVFWSFLAALIVLAGAEWTARGRRKANLQVREESRTLTH